MGIIITIITTMPVPRTTALRTADIGAAFRIPFRLIRLAATTSPKLVAFIQLLGVAKATGDESIESAMARGFGHDTRLATNSDISSASVNAKSQRRVSRRATIETGTRDN